MNKIPAILAVFTLFLIAGCSSNDEGRAAEAERHHRTAIAYQQQGQYRAAMLEARNVVQLQPQNAQGYITLAQIYNTVGAHASTQTLLEKVVDELPEVSIELADAYIASRKYRSALNVLNAITPNESERVRYLSMQAQSYIALGDKDSFEKTLQALQSREGTDAEVQYLQASYQLSQGRHEDARQTLLEALAHAPNNLEILRLLGEISLYSNQLEQAENYLTKALAQIPSGDVMTANRAEVLSFLTQALIQQGRTSEAYTYQKLLADANPEGQVMQQKFSDAMELYQQGKFAEAEVLLREIHDQFPSDKKTGALLGLVQFHQGEDIEALDMFDQYVDPETASSSLVQAAALAKFRTNQVDEAVALLKAAADNQPNDSIILATYGLALLDRDETSNEGALALEKSLAINPQQQRLRIALAKRHLAMDKPEQAIAQLQKAYREQPLDLAIQQSYFKALIDNQQIEQVRAEIADFKAANPNNPRGAFMEGWLKAQTKDYKGAQAAFEQALSANNNPDKVLVYTGLAQVYELDNQLVKSATTWQTALREDPTLTTGYSRWLRVMQRLNKTEDAITFLSELEKNTSAWQPSVVLAQVLYNQRKTAEALNHIDLALDRSNDVALVKQVAANLHSQRALELRAQQKLPEARQHAAQALEYNPDNINYLANLIEIELLSNNVSEAQKLLDQFAQSEENAAAYLFLQGTIHRVNNQPEAALRFFQQSWSAQPTDNSAEAIYTWYKRENNDSRAESMLDDWIKALPQNSRPVLIKAINAQVAGDAKAAIEWYQKTVELAPGNATALNNLARIYYEQKDSRALELAKRAHELAPASPPILDTYGWILVEQGQVREGIRYLEQAAKLAPNAEDIRQHLEAARARLN